MHVPFIMKSKSKSKSKNKKQKGGGYVNRPIKTKNLRNAIYSLFDTPNKNNNSNEINFVPASKTKHIK